MRKTGIRRKVILIICLSTFIVMMMSVSLAYIFGMSVIRDMAGDVHVKMSQLLSSQVTEMLDDWMARMRSYAGDPALREALSKERLKDSEQVPGAEAGASGLNRILSEFAGADGDVAGIAVYDGTGELIYASRVGSGRAYTNGPWLWEPLTIPDKAFIGDIEFSESAKAWVIPAAVPIPGPDGGPAGTFRADFSASRLFSFLGRFRVGRTGHATLIDGRGNILYHPGVVQTNTRLYNAADCDRLLTSKGKYDTIYEKNIHKKKVFVAFSEATPPVLLDNGRVWRALVEQDEDEVLAPLGKVVAWMGLAAIFLLVIMGVIGYIFSGVLVKPILELNAAAMQIMAGNWDHAIEIRTGDEIEQFADAFKEMLLNLRNEQEKLRQAKLELEQLSAGLENRVRERTADLTAARDRLTRYAKQLKDALDIKSDFISTVSHELRSPLAAIAEGIDIVLDAKAGPLTEQQRAFLKMADRNLARLGRVINDILDFQKLEAGKAALKIEPSDLNAIANEVCGTMVSIASKKGLELTAQLDGKLPPVALDRDRITQVITNLVDNALKFTQKGGVIVATARDGLKAVVSVSDTGPGIRREDMPMLFQKFSQIERGLERKPGGSGLGLIISKEIVELHKGSMWVESKPGEGTTFFFEIPLGRRRSDLQGDKR
jgi:signal transduction histidine kinase